MAHVYVDSNAVGAGTGADWANAYLLLDTALAAKAAGDQFWVAHNHAGTRAAAVTYTSPGTIAAPSTIACVNSAGTVPPVSADLRTTATETTTGNSAMTFAGTAYCYGVIFSAGSGAVNAGIAVGAHNWEFKSCSLIKAGTTGANSAFIFGSGAAQGRVVLDNTTVQFGSTTDRITVRGSVVWRNTLSAIAGATIPAILFHIDTPGTALIEGVDISALGTGWPVLGHAIPYTTIFKDCKLGASVFQTPTGAAGHTIITRSDSGATNYRQEKYSYTGTQTAEITIVRTGGASDGTTPLAWKIVTTANSKWLLPFECVPITFWNDTSGAEITVTVYGIWGGGAVPNNDEIWIDAEYPGSALTPQGSFATGTKADLLAAGVAFASDASVWGGSTTPFKMTATFIPQMKGPITIRIKAATASSTFYIDPKVFL